MQQARLSKTLARFGSGDRLNRNGPLPVGAPPFRANLPSWLVKAGHDPRPMALALVLAVMGQAMLPLPEAYAAERPPSAVSRVQADDTVEDRIHQMDRFRANLEQRYGRVTPSSYSALGGLTLLKAVRLAMRAADARAAGRHAEQLQAYIEFSNTVLPAVRARIGDDAIAACWPISPHDNARAADYQAKAPGIAALIRRAQSRNLSCTPTAAGMRPLA